MVEEEGGHGGRAAHSWVAGAFRPGVGFIHSPRHALVKWLCVRPHEGIPLCVRPHEGIPAAASLPHADRPFCHHNCPTLVCVGTAHDVGTTV